MASVIKGKSSVIWGKKVSTGVEDSWGQVSTTFEEEELPGVLIAEGNSLLEYGILGAELSVEKMLFLPIETKVSQEDYFIILGQRFEQVAESIKWQFPSGFRLKNRLIVALKRSTGKAKK